MAEIPAQFSEVLMHHPLSKDLDQKIRRKNEEGGKKGRETPSKGSVTKKLGHTFMVMRFLSHMTTSSMFPMYGIQQSSRPRGAKKLTVWY